MSWFKFFFALDFFVMTENMVLVAVQGNFSDNYPLATN